MDIINMLMINNISLNLIIFDRELFWRPWENVLWGNRRGIASFLDFTVLSWWATVLSFYLSFFSYFRPLSIPLWTCSSYFLFFCLCFCFWGNGGSFLFCFWMDFYFHPFFSSSSNSCLEIVTSLTYPVFSKRRVFSFDFNFSRSDFPPFSSPNSPISPY